jgi:hypothetical protein
LARDAAQRVRSPIREFDSRAGDEILDRLRDEHLVDRCLGGDACAGVDRDPANAPVDERAAKLLFEMTLLIELGFTKTQIAKEVLEQNQRLVREVQISFLAL